ncbi:MAG: dockerin type I domain-containing protein, partial [candidate division Zixibacteria bacterium]|nr:dockerin type I domain-containing protein [candidate division Zixibacteria bacterium]
GRTYFIKAQSKDEYGELSGLSTPYQVIVHTFVAGDANYDSIVDMQDAFFLIAFLYQGGPAPNPSQAGDANGSRIINIRDITYLINFLYKGGLPPNYPPGY